MEILTTIRIKSEPLDYYDDTVIKTEPQDSGFESDSIQVEVDPNDIKVEIKDELIEDDGIGSDSDTDSIRQEDSSIAMSPSSSLPNSPDSTCRVEILEQPLQKVRFRYLSELQGTPHGPLLGQSSYKNHKTWPKVRLVGYEASRGETIKMRCWLVDRHNLPRGQERPHCHDLVVRKCNPKQEIVEEPHEVVISRDNNYTAVFENMVVLHSVQKNLESKYADKACKWNNRLCLPLNMSPKSTDMTTSEKKRMRELIKSINKNEVYLYFEAFVEYRNSVQVLCSAMSNSIRNLKNSVTGDLKICKVLNSCGPCDGNTEVGLFVEKVPSDIKIKFFTHDWDQLVCPEFNHRNLALTFRTPKFKSYIDDSREVKFCLYRESDGGESNPMNFTYLPSEHSVPGKKRRFTESPHQSPQSSSLPDELDGFNVTTYSDLDPESDVLIAEVLETYGSPEDLLNDENIIRSIEWSGSSLEAALGENMILDLNVVDQNCVEEDGPSGDGNIVMSSIQHGKPVAAVKRIIKDIVLTTVYSNHINCLQRAVIQSNVAKVSSLLTFIQKCDKNNRSRTSLLQLVRKIQNNKSQTLLHMAVAYTKDNVEEMISKLLDFGFDPSLRDRNGDTCYHMAAVKPTSVQLKALISKHRKVIDADLLASYNYEGSNMLHLAVRCGVIENVNFILKNRLVPINCKDTNGGDTALHIACRHHDMNIVKLLIDNGADKSSLNLSDFSPLQISVSRNDHEMAALLIAEGSDPLQECLSLTADRFNQLESEDWESEKTDGENREDHLEISINNNAFGLAMDVMMYKILDGRTDILKLIREKQNSCESAAKVEGKLFTETQMDNLCRILSHGDNWKTLMDKLNRDDLECLKTTMFNKPERVLLNYIVAHKTELLGQTDPRAELASMFSSMGLEDARQVLTSEE